MYYHDIVTVNWVFPGNFADTSYLSLNTTYVLYYVVGQIC